MAEPCAEEHGSIFILFGNLHNLKSNFLFILPSCIFPKVCYNVDTKEKEIKKMKIFITKSYPTAGFYYRVLKFLRAHATEKEFLFYVNQVCGAEKNS